jgi:hypothetical protein
MGFLLPLLLISASPRVLVPLMSGFCTREVITATTTFCDSAFRECESSSQGGAVHLNNASISLGFARCQFSDCQTSSVGGAICAVCLSFSMNETSGVNCSAANCSFCQIVVPSSALDVRDSAAIACTAGSHTISLGSGTTLVESLNSTTNEALERASGIGMLHHIKIAIAFCYFSANDHADCLVFELDIRAGDVSCLSVANNSCAGHCLISARSTLTLADCIFQRNTFAYFVGGGARGSVSFVHCIFDVRALNATLAVSLATTRCVYEANSTSLVACGPLMAPITKSALAGRSTWAIVGIAGGACAVLITIIAVVVKRARRRRDQPPLRRPFVMAELKAPSPCWSVPLRAT